MACSECALTNEDPTPSIGFMFTWSIRNISHCTLTAGECLDSPEFEIKLLKGNKWYLRVYPKGTCQCPGFIGLFLRNDRNLHCTCKFTLSILNTNGQFKGTVKRNYNTSSETEGFPKFLSLNKLFETGGYLDNDTLTLRCRIWKEGIDTAQENYYAITQIKTTKTNPDNELEILEYGRTDDLQPKSVSSRSVSDGHQIWKENMRHFYTEDKFSDVCVRTPNQQFRVHKAIICAHSKVFCAMFEHDTKERRTGEVEIKDLDDGTVSKMLVFLYTNTVEDLDSSSAQKLFYAADKYGIEALRIICSNHLKQYLDTSNVCHVLILGDMHQDEDLKSSAKEFIAANAREILKSENWNEAKKTNSQLMFETVEWLLCNKFLKLDV